MSVSIAYELEPNDIAEALRENQKHGLSRLLRYGVGVGIPAIQTVFILNDSAARSSLSHLLIDLIIWWVLFPLVFIGFTAVLRHWSVRRAVKDDATRKGTQVRRLDAEGLHIAGGGVDATIGWSALRSAKETSRFFVLFQTRDAAYFLPKRVMNADTMAQVRAILRQRLPKSRLQSG